MSIRPERSDDIDAIDRLVHAAFLDHPQHAPGAPPTEHNIVKNLRAAQALALSLVAEEDGAIVGHIALSEVLIDGADAGWHGGGPLAVLPSHQRRGIGAALVRQAVAEMRERGARGVVLVGDPADSGRFAFTPEPGLVLEGVPPEYVLALTLAPPTPAGTVRFHPAFGC